MKLFYQNIHRKRLFPIILLGLTFFAAPACAIENQPWVSAASAVLVDGKSGEVLLAKDPYSRRAMASTTKIMTAVIAMERLKMDEVVMVSKRANEVGESEVYLDPGERMTVKNLLYGMLVKSGNDAAYALSEKIAGSEHIFAQLMNKKAEELGLRDTHFANCDGLPARGHYSSAKDLAMLGVYAMRNPLFRAIVATKIKHLPWPGKPWRRVLENRNKLLWNYRYCTGIKTGFTDDAGRCLVASASRDGSDLISVVLKSQDSFADSERILKWGFRNYKFVSLIRRNEKYAELNLPYGLKRKLSLVAQRSASKQIPQGLGIKWLKIIFYPRVELPVRKGQVFGKIVAYDGDKIVASSSLVSKVSVRKPSLKFRTRYYLRLIKKRIIQKMSLLPFAEKIESL